MTFSNHGTLAPRLLPWTHFRQVLFIPLIPPSWFLLLLGLPWVDSLCFVCFLGCFVCACAVLVPLLSVFFLVFLVVWRLPFLFLFPPAFLVSLAPSLPLRLVVRGWMMEQFPYVVAAGLPVWHILPLCAYWSGWCGYFPLPAP